MKKKVKKKKKKKKITNNCILYTFRISELKFSFMIHFKIEK